MWFFKRKKDEFKQAAQVAKPTLYDVAFQGLDFSKRRSAICMNDTEFTRGVRDALKDGRTEPFEKAVDLFCLRSFQPNDAVLTSSIEFPFEDDPLTLELCRSSWVLKFIDGLEVDQIKKAFSAIDEKLAIEILSQALPKTTDLKKLEKLVAAGADPNYEHALALRTAAREAQTEKVAVLVGLGASLSQAFFGAELHDDKKAMKNLGLYMQGRLDGVKPLRTSLAEPIVWPELF